MSQTRKSSVSSNRSYISDGRIRPPSANNDEIKGAYLAIIKDLSENITTRHQLAQGKYIKLLVLT